MTLASEGLPAPRLITPWGLVEFPNSLVNPGVHRITVDGGAGNDRLQINPGFFVDQVELRGGEGDDLLIGAEGNDTLDGGDGDDVFIGNGGTDAIAGGPGTSVGDTILVRGTSGADTIALSLNASGHLVATVNGLTTVYTNSTGGPIATSGIEQVLVLGLNGNDALTVDSTNGALPIPVTFDGGDNSDALTLTGGTATSATYTPGPNPGQGTHALVIGGVTQTVRFSNLEPVIDLVAGPLVVNATAADNAINYSQGADATRGLISIDGFETIEFSNKTTLTINGLAGSDTINLNNPNTPTGLTGITVNGGDPTASDKLIVNGIAGTNDRFIVIPTAAGAGSVSNRNGTTGNAQAPDVTFSGIEGLSIVGQAEDADGLAYTGTTGNDTFILTPGANPASGLLTGSAPGFAFVPITFAGISDYVTASAAFVNKTTFLTVITPAIGGNDTLALDGSAADDVFDWDATLTFAAQVRVNTGSNIHTPVVLSGANNAFGALTQVTLRGLTGNDTFNLAPPPATGFNGYTLRVEGGDSDGSSDVLNYTGTAAVTIDLAARTVTQTGNNPISFAGVENLNVSAGANAITITGTPGPDDVTVTPTGANTATITVAGLNLVINTTNTAALTVNAAGGSDTITVHGTSGNDIGPGAINVVRGATTTVQVGALKTISVASAGPDTLVVDAGLGQDAINVSGTGSPLILQIEGGDPQTADILNITNTTAGASTVNGGADPHSGNVGTPDGQVFFNGISLVTLTAAAATDDLTVIGTTGDDAITLLGGGGTNNVGVNDRFGVSFTGFDGLTLIGGTGSDTFSLSPAGLTGVATVQVNGGDPTAGSDKLVVTATAGNDAIGYNPSDTLGSGSVTITGQPTVNFTTTESVVIDGNGGTDGLTVTTPGGTHQVTYTPGTAPDAGAIAVRGAGSGTALVPLNFLHLGASGNVTFASGAGAREDVLELYGTNDSDVFNVNQTADRVQILNPTGGFVTVALNTGGISLLQLRALDGDDTFNLTGALPYNQVLVDAGSPSASDVVNLSGASGPVTVDLAAGTVTGFGGVVTLLGVETLNLSAGANAITILGTGNPDDLSITPTSANTARITVAGLNLVINTNNTAALNVNLAGGSDQLSVLGTQNGETITVNGTSVTVGALKAVSYSNTENLRVLAQAGTDVIDVTPAAGTTIFVDGGDPIGSTSGDRIVLNPTGAFVIQPGPEPDEGGLIPTGAQRVSWDHIEEVVINGGGPALVLGTNGDDDITVIARDASTHAGTDGVQDFTVSVNDTLNLLFINQPALFIDALAGDDDIVIRAPAPNLAEWDVDVTLAGGPPASPTGDQGDVLELETPGTNNVIFTPTGPETGTLVLDQAANDSTISFVASFTFDPAGINYISSPGGIEKVVYDGVSQAGVDNLTVNGTLTDDVLNFGSIPFGGTFRSILSPAFEFSLTGRVTFNGAGGTDAVNLSGTEEDDVVTSTGNAVSVTAPGSLIILTLGTGVERLNLFTLGGNDNIDLDLNVAGLQIAVHAGEGNDVVNLLGTLNTPGATIVGGLGDDFITGSTFNDLIYGDDPAGGGGGNDTLVGGAGNDTLFGGAGNDIFGNPTAAFNGVADDSGNDQFFGEAGSDLFFWEPGDGDDTIEGGAGDADQLFFSGNAGAEQFFIFADVTTPARAHLFRVQGGIDIDMADVEEVNLTTLGGADTVTVGRSDTGILADLSTTGVRAIDVSLGADGAADTVNFNGRPLDDNLLISVDTGIVKVAGLNYDLRVDGTDPALDRLAVFGNAGNDTIKAEAGVENTVLITLDGGTGNDFLSADATLIGGIGNDTLIGGAGDDLLQGGAGDDLMQGGAGNDTYDGGAGFDTILIEGTPGNDQILVSQTAAATLIYSVNGVTETDTLVLNAGVRTVEAASIVAKQGADVISVTWADGLGVDGLLNALRYDIDGGNDASQDRLGVIDGGTGDLVLYRKNEDPKSGSITVGPGNAEPLDVVFQNIEVAQPVAGTGGQVAVFKTDPYEFNDTRLLATHLGAGQSINVDPLIDPGADPVFGLPADQDWFRVEAQTTGTLDFQVFFTQIATVPSGRPGLPNAGNLDIEVYDQDGTLIVAGFGTNDATDNERIRIPAVQGQVYFLRVIPNGTAINTYSISVLNEAAPAPFDLEVSDVIETSAVTFGGATTQFNGGAALSAQDDFYNGKYVEFSTSVGNALLGQRVVVVDYIGATRTFIVAPGLSRIPLAGETFHIESNDTGRSQFDNHTRDNTPTIFIRLDDAFFLNDLPGNSTPSTPPDEVIPIPFRSTAGQRAQPGYAIAIFDEGATPPQANSPILTPLGYATMVEPGLYSFTLPTLVEGSHFITARVQMIDPAGPPVTGWGPRSASLEVVIDVTPPPVFFGLPNVAGDGLDASSDSGTPGDNITNDTTPTLFGTAEANAVVRVYADLNLDNQIDSRDVLIAQTVAAPLDGTNQFPNGRWVVTSNVSLNDPRYFPVPDGQRRLLLVAEDLAGNLSSPPQVLDLFIDTSGPRVTNVFITPVPGFDLFDPKPSQGPTPRVPQLTITFVDQPPRTALFMPPALDPALASNPAHYQVRGDKSGLIAVRSVTVINDPVVIGQPATASVILTFFEPLPDDRFTVSVDDEVRDPAGNGLDGESNAVQPLEVPLFPSGNGIPGGDFLARFTVDTRPEVGAFGQGQVNIDINGNGLNDPSPVNNDAVNRDFGFLIGIQSDYYFAGNFANGVTGIASGFDKVGVYGFVGGAYRFLMDTNDDGVIDMNVVSGLQVNGHPVAGNFRADRSGDEIGLFDGTRWYLDSNGNNNIDSGDRIVINGLRGLPIVGDFDGDGLDDLATYQPDRDLFQFDLAFNGLGGLDAVIAFGQPGVAERPVAADMDMDGVTDIGLFMPGQVDPQVGEAKWYFLVSGDVLGAQVNGPRVTGSVSTLNHAFKTRPFGADLEFNYGNEFALPLVGNFDPPISVVNTAPVLDVLPNVTTHAANVGPITLLARDAERDTVSYSVRVLASSPQASQLRQQHGLSYAGGYHDNAQGMGERWMYNPSTGVWYAILPGGELRRWGGSWANSPSLAQLEPLFHADPSLLWNAQAPQVLPVVAASRSGNQLTLQAPTGFVGTYWVEVTASDGQANTVKVFSVTRTNAAPMVGEVPPQAMTTGLPSMTVTLFGTDPDGDALTYSAKLVGSTPQALQLKQQLGFRMEGGSYHVNAQGMGEKWLYSPGTGVWHAILPSGELRRWGGSWATSPVVAQLESFFHADPSLLWNAQPAQSQAFQLKRDHGLTYPGSYYHNAHGHDEKWLYNPTTGVWYALVPTADAVELRRLTGAVSSLFQASNLVATLDKAYWNNPAYLHDATADSIVPVFLTVNGNQIVVDPAAGYTGTFLVAATASDGLAGTTRYFSVNVSNSAPVFQSIADQTMPAAQDKTTIPLNATDADGDALVYTAQVRTIQAEAYRLLSTLGLSYTGSYHETAHNLNAKWLYNTTTGVWYAILFNGEVRRWTGSVSALMSDANLEGKLDNSYWADPGKLLTATAVSGAAPAKVSVSGNQLVVDPDAGFTGSLVIDALVKDGTVTVKRSFVVKVG